MMWQVATLGLALCLAPCGWVALTAADVTNRLVGLEMSAAVLTLLLATLAEAMHRPLFLDLSLTLALLSFGGGLVFTRFLERWL